MRGAVNGLSAEVMEDHLRNHIVDPDKVVRHPLWRHLITGPQLFSTAHQFLSAQELDDIDCPRAITDA